MLLSDTLSVCVCGRGLAGGDTCPGTSRPSCFGDGRWWHPALSAAVPGRMPEVSVQASSPFHRREP